MSKGHGGECIPIRPGKMIIQVMERRLQALFQRLLAMTVETQKLRSGFLPCNLSIKA